MAELFRLGVSAETKNTIVPAIDQKRFLRFDEDDRSALYSFAAAVCARTGMPPKKETCESFVMDKSVKDNTMAVLILLYFVANGEVESGIDKVGLKQRKDLVNEHLNPMANSGFGALMDMMKKPDDIIISKFIEEMDIMYAEAAGICKSDGIPDAKPFCMAE